MFSQAAPKLMFHHDSKVERLDILLSFYLSSCKSLPRLCKSTYPNSLALELAMTTHCL